MNFESMTERIIVELIVYNQAELFWSVQHGQHAVRCFGTTITLKDELKALYIGGYFTLVRLADAITLSYA